MKASTTSFGLGVLALSLISSACVQADQIAMANLYQATAPKSVPANGTSANPMSNQAAACPKAGPYLSMEYLYWKLEQEQLYAGIFLSATPQAGGNSLVNFKLKEQKFEFTSGFRATVGYDLPYENYDLFLAWTRIHPETTSHLTSNSDSSVLASLLDGISQSDLPQVESLRSKWHLAFDMLDLGIGRKFIVGKRFGLRPFFGLKGGWIDQKQKFNFYNIKINNDHNPSEDGLGKRKSDFKGVGPLLGLDMRCGIGSQFGLFATASSALLYGHFNLKANASLDSLPVGDNSFISYSAQNPHNRLTPFAQILVGGDWTRCIYNKWWIRFGAAFETQYWWNIMGANTSPGDLITVNYPSGGDLMIHGLTLQARFDF